MLSVSKSPKYVTVSQFLLLKWEFFVVFTSISTILSQTEWQSISMCFFSWNTWLLATGAAMLPYYRAIVELEFYPSTFPHCLCFALQLQPLADRRMDFEEFCAAATSPYHLEALEGWEQIANKAFEYFEQEGNKAITIEELAEVSTYRQSCSNF